VIKNLIVINRNNKVIYQWELGRKILLVAKLSIFLSIIIVYYFM